MTIDVYVHQNFVKSFISKMFKVEETVIENVVKTFDKDKESTEDDIRTIQKWISEQPHFLQPLERRSITNFLILNKFSIEKTKQKIDNYYTTRTKLEEIYKEITPKFSSNVQEFIQIAYLLPHPQLLDYNRVFFFKIRNPDLAEQLDNYVMARYVVACQEIRMREDVMYGDIFVIDCKHLPLSFFLKLTPTFLYKFFFMIYQQIYSIRLKGMYMINFPSFGETLVKILKTIMKRKIFERIHFLSEESLINEKFPEDFLPVDFGGKGISLEKLQEMADPEYEQHLSFFDYLEKFKVDENLRPAKLENDEMLGFYGNFKKLNID
ncbi:retinaldehyde-binding protein 1-like [Zophobas morio]|uniref:retinaldehyde-binding protein 1-like n=1 Tax=Zophobas morio TaxID=2755281 RepID=UPI003082D388